MTSCTTPSPDAGPPPKPAAAPKCVVWDLDDTLWNGVLLEGDPLVLRQGVRETLAALDARGILNSIASRNDPALAQARLRALELADYFLFPQIGWGAKSEAIRRIARALNIATDAIVFVDDQRFEHDEVRAALPSVRCVDAARAATLIDLLGVRDLPITGESRSRRALYLAEQARGAAEARFDGPAEAFLASLRMVVTIAPAREHDLDRADELTRRTHQLNSTGRTYSRRELQSFCESQDHQLLIVSLEDTYGSYGRVGLALLGCGAEARILKLLLMSCRVISRGIGALVLHHLMREAADAGVRFLAHFVRTDRNRQMYITYRLAGFREIGRDGPVLVLQHDLDGVPPPPPYVRLVRVPSA